MFTTRKRGRTAAVFGAVAGLLLTTATAANAAPSPTIDPDEEGSITITKLVEPETAGTTAPGTEVPGHGGTPIEGVTFKIEIVTAYDFDGDGIDADDKIDLTTAAGWQNAEKLATLSSTNPALFDKSQVGQTRPTDASGELTFSGLPLGLYLVTEVSTSGAKIGGQLVSATGGSVVPAADPFFITVPMTDPDDRDNWMYDVYVYPKNRTVGLEKSIVDGDEEVLGDKVTYKVSMDVPADTTSLIITDEIDARLAYVENSVVTFPDGVMITEVDYDAQTLTVKFTPGDGQTKLPVGKVGFTFEAEVIATGEIPNDATYDMIVNGETFTGTSPEVLTKWGGYDVAKVDENGAWLKDAVFSLYEVRYVFDAQGNRVLDGPGKPKENVSLIEAGIVSDQNGKIEVGGLRYSRWADNAAVDEEDPGFVFYRLIETKAPETFELQATPIDFEVSGPADRAEGSETGIDLKIVNVLHNAGFELPAIGGNRAVLPIVAAVIAAGGVVWLIRSRREQQV